MNTKPDPLLLQILICPNCKGEVVMDDDASVIRCIGECRYEYPIIDGIPHMLVAEAKKP